MYEDNTDISLFFPSAFLPQALTYMPVCTLAVSHYLFSMFSPSKYAPRPCFAPTLIDIEAQ